MARIIKDRGQELPVPEQRTIGFIDTPQQFEKCVNALRAAGYADRKITGLHGEDGIELLKRLREVLFFGDEERAVVDLAITHLEAGHFSIAVEVKDRDDGLRVAAVCTPHGGHTFTYFGKWVNEQLTS